MYSFPWRKVCGGTQRAVLCLYLRLMVPRMY